MNAASWRDAAIAAVLVAAATSVDAGVAGATDGALFDLAPSPIFEAVDADETAVPDPVSIPNEIAITGDSDPVFAAEAAVLDGEYVIAAGGSQQSAVLGSVIFDPTGTVVTGSLTIITAARSDTAPTVAPTLGDGEDDAVLAPLPPLAATATTSATAVDCAVTGGAYSLAESGGGEANLDLDCGGSESAVTWRLFVTATDGFTQARQLRAVQLEPAGAAGADGIIDLLLTLR